MKISSEQFGAHRNFYDSRDQLIVQGRRFDEAALRRIPYDQLFLCCIGNAREAMCDPTIVCEERRYRRERFLHMEPTELTECESFLRGQGMYDDVITGIRALGTPHWNDLNYRQKAWAKVNCLFNHIDDPHLRMYDAIGLLGAASPEEVPTTVAAHYMGKLKQLINSYPIRLPDAIFRNNIEAIRDNLRDFLPEPERSICLEEEIRDFSCTSDCFRLL